MGHPPPCECPKQVLIVLCPEEMVYEHQQKGGELWAVCFGHVLAVVTIRQIWATLCRTMNLLLPAFGILIVDMKKWAVACRCLSPSQDRDWAKHTTTEVALQPTGEDFVHESLHF